MPSISFLNEGWSLAHLRERVGQSPHEHHVMAVPYQQVALAGPGFFKDLAQQLKVEFPDRHFEWRLDCGDNSALALWTIELGGMELDYSGPTETRLAFEQMASAKKLSLQPRGSVETGTRLG